MTSASSQIHDDYQVGEISDFSFQSFSMTTMQIYPSKSGGESNGDEIGETGTSRNINAS